MNSYLYLWKIKRYLAWFTSHVKLENKSGNTDTSKFVETFIIPILNKVLNSEFKRLEFVKRNFPAIDLGSSDGEISFQITSEKGPEKIRNTITTYLENKLYEQFEEMYLFVIDETYKPQIKDEELNEFIEAELKRLKIGHKIQKFFTLKTNFWNVDILRESIEKNCNPEQIKEISEYFEKEYLPIQSLPTFDDILIPYEVAFKSQLDVTNNKLSYQFHTPFFGREDDINKLEAFINNPKSSVFALISDGGYGKTRLTVELFKMSSQGKNDFEAYVLNESAFHCMDFAEQLKTEKQVVILFDDAHNKPEILDDAIGVANRLPNVKLILTIRKAVYSDTIKVIKTHNRAFETLELSCLSYDETQQLFRTQLVGLKDFEIKRLSEKSKGVPIVVLGLCQIKIGGKYNSELSEEANFIQFVRELKDQVIVDIHNKYFISKKNINKTIELISFFSPIKNIPEEISELSRLNSLSIEETGLILDYLQEYDFIDKHRDIAIKPDPYSETILLESAHRIKYILQQDLKIFIDRLIRNLVEVEQSQRLDLSLDNLLFDFVTSFKNIEIESNESLKTLKINLDTLKSFTFKKPQICFLAINHLISSQLNNKEFWITEDDFVLYTISYKEVHESIQTVLSISAINTHTISDFENIYNLLRIYDSKKDNNKIFHEVFRYRIYDFYEFGYNPRQPCERQVFLVNKLNFLIEGGELGQDLIDHIVECCNILLTLEFEAESFYDKYTHSYTYGRNNVIYNETTKWIRENVLNILFKVYTVNRFSKESEEYFQKIVNVLFFMGIQRRKEYEFNQETEVDLVVEFLKKNLSDSPSMFERSCIIRQLKIFNRKELKDQYKKTSKELLTFSEKVSTPRDKLNLLFLDEYFSLKDNIETILKDLLEQYGDWKEFYKDIVELKISLVKADYTNFQEIISQISNYYPEKAKELLDFVIERYSNQVCDFNILIRANYKDQVYFYDTIDKIWNIELECSKASVLWALTYGRNQETKLYKEDDLEYIEYVIDNELTGSLWSISFTLSKYILISPKRTISAIGKLLKIANKTNREIDHLIHSIFENNEILEEHSVLIKDFIFNETLEIPLDSYYFENALSFIENKFGFNTLFDYLKKKVKYLEVHNDYFYLSYHKHYDNQAKDSKQKEKDFLVVIEWYADLESKSEFLHKKVVEYMRPQTISSNEFVLGFKLLIENSENNIKRIVDICNALDVYENKGEFILSLLIEVSNELCQKFDITYDNLVQIFGSNFIHNLGTKSGPAGGAFPQDIAKRDYLIKLMGKYEMHPKVKGLFTDSLDKVNKDIERDELRDYEAKW